MSLSDVVRFYCSASSCSAHSRHLSFVVSLLFSTVSRKGETESDHIRFTEWQRGRWSHGKAGKKQRANGRNLKVSDRKARKQKLSYLKLRHCCERNHTAKSSGMLRLWVIAYRDHCLLGQPVKCRRSLLQDSTLYRTGASAFEQFHINCSSMRFDTGACANMYRRKSHIGA